MNVNAISIRILGAALAVASVVGCGGKTTSEVSEQKSIVTKDLDIHNFNNSAKELTEKMLVAPRVQQEFAAFRGGRPLIKISRIKNDTTLKVNMVDYLVTPMEEVLVNSGKTDFFAEDKMSQDAAAAQDLLNKTSPRMPDYTLNGTVSRLRTSNSDAEQNAYIFQIRLTSTRTGADVFVGTNQIIKQTH